MTEPLLEFERGKDINPLQQWADFKKRLWELMLERNDSINNNDDWESPETPGKKISMMDVDNWIEYASTRGLNGLKVYPFKRQGLRLDLESTDIDPRSPIQQQLHLVKACRKGFIRDWKRDGVCVKETEMVYIKHFPDLSDYEGQTLSDLHR